MGTATQALAAQERAALARTDQQLRALDTIDRITGGPGERSLQRRKEFEQFKAGLDTPERQLAERREIRLEQAQKDTQAYRERYLDIISKSKAPEEKQRTTALKEMTKLAKDIGRLTGKNEAIAPELWDAYAMAAMQAGASGTVLPYLPEPAEGVLGYAAEGLANLIGFGTEPIQVTAYEYLLLRDLELRKPDWDYETRVERLQALREKHGGQLSGPPNTK